MPGFDRTGPMGAGPMTGGARGVCNPQDDGRRGTGPYYGGAGYGRGLGLRRGFGGGRGDRGWGRGYGMGANWPEPPYARGYMGPNDDLEYLKQQADDMADALDAIKNRIDRLSKTSSESS